MGNTLRFITRSHEDNQSTDGLPHVLCNIMVLNRADFITFLF